LIDKINLTLRHISMKMSIRLHKVSKYFISFLLLTTSILLFGQNGQNPFDIKSQHQIELEKIKLARDTSSSIDSQTTSKANTNPFEIVAPVSPSQNNTPIIAPIIPTITTETVSLRENGQGFLFAIVLGVLLFLTVLVTMSRNLISRIYQSFLNDTVLKTLYRERGPLTSSFYIALYAMFLVNLGVFFFLILFNYNKIFNHSQLYTLFYCIIGVAVIFTGKHALLKLLAFIFPINKEMNLYSFIIVVFGILIGLILAPVNVFLAYADTSTAQIMIVATSVGILGIYAFRSLRSLILAQNYILPNFFHFLLYLCAVEIAPILIILKMLSKYIQF
jgi:hypothetical protein